MKRALVLALALVSACRFMDRRVVPEPGRNEVIRVESGERLYFDLKEEGGLVWDCRSDDNDAEVSVERGGQGTARVSVRIHRGFDGPATLRFSCRRKGEKAEGPESFTVALFRRTGEAAFWK